MRVLNIISPLMVVVSVAHFTVQVSGKSVDSKASLSYNNGEMILTSAKGKDIVLQPGDGGEVMLKGPALFKSSNAACNSKRAGIIRFHGGRLQVCNGRRFITVGAKLGSKDNPASSCQAILEDDWSAPNGAYYLETGTSVTKVYCYMGAISGCGKGFTMIMKISGSKNTFHYNSGYWKNNAAFNPSGGAKGVDQQETKLPTYWTLPITRLCLGIKAGSQMRWIPLHYKARSLYSLIADGRYRATSLGRGTWKSLISGSSLQRNCNREGFNVYHPGQMARIGIFANQENDCNSPDSRIAFGGGGANCGTHDSNTCGNEARCGGDGGDKSTKAFCYILAK